MLGRFFFLLLFQSLIDVALAYCKTPKGDILTRISDSKKVDLDLQIYLQRLRIFAKSKPTLFSTQSGHWLQNTTWSFLGLTSLFIENACAIDMCNANLVLRAFSSTSRHFENRRREGPGDEVGAMHSSKDGGRSTETEKALQRIYASS